MGGSSKPRKTKEFVTKNRGALGSVGGNRGGSADKCMLVITFNHSSSSEIEVNPGDSAVIIPKSSTTLEVFIKGEMAGEYLGQKKRLLLSCIEKGFVYEGEVISINDFKAIIRVKGNG